MIPANDNNSLATDCKEIETDEMSDEAFKRIIIWKLNEIQEDTDKSLHKISKTM